MRKRLCAIGGFVVVFGLFFPGCIIVDDYRDDAAKTKACEKRTSTTFDCKKCCVTEQKADSHTWYIDKCTCQMFGR